MNAKPGDIALVRPPTTGGFCDWTGLLVEVIEPLTREQHYPDIGWVEHMNPPSETEWLCRIVGNEKRPETYDDGLLIMTSYGRMWDHRLKPFRDNPGADETLSWKDVPQEVAA